MRSIPILFLVVSFQISSADLIECDNGDRYHGKVLSMDEKQVKLKNEITGTLTIPRGRIVTISFRAEPSRVERKAGTAAVTNATAIQPGQKINVDPGTIEKVQNELLSTATPEANEMFQEMIRGLQGGQLNLADIRAQAETTLKELRELQKDLGDDETAGLLSSYGSILENFIRQAPKSPATNALPARPRIAVPDEEE